MLVGAVLPLLLMAPAHGQDSSVVVVNTTSVVVDFLGDQVRDLPGPDGLVTLSEAIIAANFTPGPQVIEFDIPTTDPGYDGQTFTIAPVGDPLPGIIEDGGTTIDGTTQPTLSNPHGPEIVIDGSAVFAGQPGIYIETAGNTIRGLTIHGFHSGIVLNSFAGTTADNNFITQCYIGTDATGAAAIGNGRGIGLDGQGNIVRNNLVSGNSRGQISDSPLGGSLIEDNLIGTDRTGTVALLEPFLGGPSGISLSLPAPAKTVIRGNLISGNGFGIIVADSGYLGPQEAPLLIEENKIGTDTSGLLPVGNIFGIAWNFDGASGPGSLIRRNVIAYNGDVGVWVGGVVGNTITENSIFGNSVNEYEVTLGIDLSDACCPDGVTPNDPGDLDTGGNELMNYPVLESALATPGKLVVRGTVDTQNPAAVLVEFFAADGDSSGHGEGKIFLGRKSPNPRGKFMAALDSVEPGTLITATATDEFGNTSEFSANIVAVAPGN